MLIDGTLSSLDSRVASNILNEIKNGELFADKIVLMVTYDLDQASQLDWVLHISDTGSLKSSSSTSEFFSDQNLQNVQSLRKDIKVDEPQTDIELEEKDAQPSSNQGIIKSEQNDLDKISYAVIGEYFKFCDAKYGGRFSVYIIVILHIIINFCAIWLSLYLAYVLSDFGGDNSEKKEALSENKEFVQMLFKIMGSCLVSTVVGKYISSLIFMSINKNLHKKVVESLIKTKMVFFDENTSGTIVNRLSQDIAKVDQIVFTFLEMIDYIIKCSLSVTFIVFSCPIVVFVVVAQLYYFYLLRKKILFITRDCFRLK